MFANSTWFDPVVVPSDLRSGLSTKTRISVGVTRLRSSTMTVRRLCCIDE